MSLPLCTADEDLLPRPSRADRRGGHSRGFDVHAGVVIGPQDREGRERLLRYCARPALSLQRLSVTPQGLVAYRVRKPWTAEQTHRVMTPLEFMARLAAIIPPPRHPLIRCHGVFAPHSSWRASVVPQVHPKRTALCADTREDAGPMGDGSTILDDQGAASEPRPAPRLTWYIDWATLLARAYHVDALRCACGGRLRFIAVITDPDIAREILLCMGLPGTQPPIPRARAPDLDVVATPPDWE